MHRAAWYLRTFRELPPTISFNAAVDGNTRLNRFYRGLAYDACTEQPPSPLPSSTSHREDRNRKATADARPPTAGPTLGQEHRTKRICERGSPGTESPRPRPAPFLRKREAARTPTNVAAIDSSQLVLQLLLLTC